jgi:predicted NUDIX family NTP pyrophosphohydrolase
VNKQSAGILAYRQRDNELEVLLVHPGGPFFARKDMGAWSIPKGEFTNDESPLQAARREFKEETGYDVEGTFIELTPVKLKSGKLVYAWAVAYNIDATQIVCNTFSLEWPPKSGKMKEFPEVDKAEWFTTAVAKEKINEAQIKLIDELISKVKF